MAIAGHTTIVFAELSISDSTTLLVADSGWDLVYDGKTFLGSNKLLVEVGKTEQTLDFVDNPMQISLNANLSDALLTSVNDNDYVYRDAIVYKGIWDVGIPLNSTDTDLHSAFPFNSNVLRFSNTGEAGDFLTAIGVSSGGTTPEGLFIRASASGAEQDFSEITLTQSNNEITVGGSANQVLADSTELFFEIKPKISKVKIIKGGFLDTHNDSENNGVITFIINSFSALAARGRDDVTAEVSQNNKLKDGVYGEANKTVTDSAFQNSGKRLEGLGLGGTLAYSVTEWNGRGGEPCSTDDHIWNDDPEFATTNYAATSAIRFGNTGDGFHIPVAFGETKVNAGFLDGKNPTESEVHSIYGSDWASATDHGDPAKKYLTTYWAVAHGEIGSLKMFSNHSSDTYEIMTSGGSDTQTTYIKSGGNKIAAITVVRGTTGQTGFGSNAPSWRSDAKGIGVCMVAITLVAWSDWPSGIPSFTYVVDSTKIRSLSSSGFSTTKSATNKVGEVIGDYLTNKAYGLGLPDSALDIPSFHAANSANAGLAVDMYPTLLRGSVTGSGSYRGFIQKMLDSCSMTLYENDGKLSLFFGKPITDSEIAKDFYGTSSAAMSNCSTSQKKARARSIPNEATARYYALYKESGKTPTNTRQTVIVSDGDGLEEDKGFKSTISISLDFLTTDGEDGVIDTDGVKIVKETANLLIRRERTGSQKLTITTDYINTSELKLSDIVEVDEPRYKWTGVNARRYRVVGIADDHSGRVSLNCNRYKNEIYKGVDNFTGTRVEQVAPTTSSYDTTLTDNSPVTGDIGPSGISNRLTIAYAPNADGSSAIFPTGLLTGDVDSLLISLTEPATGTSSLIVASSMVGTADNNFLVNTGTSTGTTLVFRSAATNATDSAAVHLGFNQPGNTTLESQVDAMITDFNSIEVLGSSTATTIGAFTLQRNAIAIKVDGTSFRLIRLTNEDIVGTPTSQFTNFPGTVSFTFEDIQRNTYSAAISRITDIYSGEELVTWEAPAAEPAVSNSKTNYVWTKIQGDTGATGDSPFSIYRVSTSLPSTPSGGSYNSTTDILTPPSGWHNTVSAAKAAVGAGKLYQSNTKYLFRTNTLATWEDPFDVGQGAPQLTGISVADKGTSGNNRNFDITSTLTDDEGNTSTVTSNEFGLPDKFAGLNDVNITTSASTDMALIWDASSDEVQQISYKDIIDSGKSASSIGYIPVAPGSNGTYTLTKNNSTFTWAADATGNLPTLPSTNGSYHLVRTGGTYSWAVDAEMYLPNAGPTSDGRYNLRRTSGVLTWEADGAGGIPSIPANITTNTSKIYNLKLTDVSGTETATWEEDTGSGYLPSSQPTSNKKYVLDISSGGTATWLEVQGDDIPDSPSSDIFLDKQYQLKVGLGGSGATTWVEADAVPSYLPTFQPFTNGKYRLKVLSSGLSISWELDDVPDVPSGNGEYSLKINGASTTWVTAGANGVNLPTTNGEYALSRASGVFSYFNPDSFKLPDLPTGNGEYVLRRLSGSWTWVDEALIFDLPNAPTGNGVFALTHSGGTNTWTDQSGTLSLPSIPAGNGEYNLKVASSVGSWELDAGDPAVISNGSNDPTLNSDTGTTALTVRTLIGAGTGDGTVTDEPAIISNGSGDPTLNSDAGTTAAKIKTLIGASLGWTGVTYSSSTGKITFVSTDGLGFVTSDIRGGQGIQGLGYSGVTLNANNTLTFTGVNGNSDVTTGSVKGDGWNNGSYNNGTGQVTFTSVDGLGFVTGDLRGADSVVAGPAGVGFKNYVTLTAFNIGDAVISGNKQWRVLTAVPATNTAVPAENSTWSEFLTKSQDQTGGGSGSASSAETHYAKFALADTITGPTRDSGYDSYATASIAINNTGTLGDFNELLYSINSSTCFQLFGSHTTGAGNTWTDKDGSTFAGNVIQATRGNPLYRGSLMSVAAGTNAEICADILLIIEAYWTSLSRDFTLSVLHNTLDIGIPDTDVTSVTSETVTQSGSWLTASSLSNSDTLWFNDPDLLPTPGYTHTSVRRTTHTTEGVSTRHQYTVSGNGGGSLTESADMTISGTAGTTARTPSGVSSDTTTDSTTDTHVVVGDGLRIMLAGGNLYSESSGVITLVLDLSSSTDSIRDVCTDGNGNWMAVGVDSTDSETGVVYSSTDADSTTGWVKNTNYAGDRCQSCDTDGTHWLLIADHVSSNGVVSVHTSSSPSGSFTIGSNIAHQTSSVGYADGTWISLGTNAFTGNGSAYRNTNSDPRTGWGQVTSSTATSWRLMTSNRGGVQTDGNGSWVMSNSDGGIFSVDDGLTWQTPGFFSQALDGQSPYMSYSPIDNKWYTTTNTRGLLTSDVPATNAELSSFSSVYTTVDSTIDSGFPSIIDYDDTYIGRRSSSTFHTVDYGSATTSFFSLTLDDEFATSPITGTITNDAGGIVTAADIRTAIAAATTAGDVEKLTVTAGTDNVITITPTVAGDFDTPLLTFTGGGDLSAVIVVNMTTPTGSEESILTIVKTGGQRNGTHSYSLETSSTLVSQIDDIVADIAGSDLYLRCEKISSSTFQVTSIDQGACTITVSITLGAVPAGSASISQTVIRAGTNPVVTLQGDVWSRPVNSGVTPV